MRGCFPLSRSQGIASESSWAFPGKRGELSILVDQIKNACDTLTEAATELLDSIKDNPKEKCKLVRCKPRLPSSLDEAPRTTKQAPNQACPKPSCHMRRRCTKATWTIHGTLIMRGLKRQCCTSTIAPAWLPVCSNSKTAHGNGQMLCSIRAECRSRMTPKNLCSDRHPAAFITPKTSAWNTRSVRVGPQ